MMLERSGGRIVAVSSLAAYRGMPGSGAYNASKAALTTLMESLRAELHGSGVTLTTVAPGFIRTEMTEKNEFFMPFLMEPEEAARRIVRAIDRGSSEYRFPIGTSLLVRLIQLIPNAIYDRTMAWARKKGTEMRTR
jgi:short-subunit dehydrogenase